MAKDVSGLFALQFGGEISGEVGSSAVDIASACSAVDGTEQIAVPMPQAGCVRALSIKFETGVASGRTATLAITIGGTESTVGVMALAALDTEGTVTFDNEEMTFDADDEIGLSLTGDAGSSILVQALSATIFAQLGRSNI